MDNNNSYSKISSYILLFCLATLSFTPIAAWITPLRRDWIVLFFAVFCIFSITKRLSIGKSTKPLIFYAVVVLANAMMGDKMFSSVPIGLVEILLIYVPSAVILWIILSNNIPFVKRILLLSLIFFVLEGLASYILIRSYPSLMRTIYSVAHLSGDMNIQYSYFRLGLMDYSMAHAVPVLIAPLFYLYKTASAFRIKMISVFCIIFCVFITWLSDSTTALMLSILMVVLGFLTKTVSVRANSRKLIIIILLTTPLFVSEDIQLFVLDTAENVLGSESIFADKIDEFRSSILYGETGDDMQGRIDRYQKSFNLFVHSPIWGANKDVGNHAAILDRMGALGLLGIIPLFLFFKCSLAEIKNNLPSSSVTFFYEGVLAVAMMLMTKGMWFWPMFFCLFILMPSILIYANQSTNS